MLEIQQFATFIAYATNRFFISFGFIIFQWLLLCRIVSQASMKSNVIILLLFFTITSSSLSSQEAFNINWKKEWTYIGAGIGSGIAGYYLLSQATPITNEEYLALDASQINRFDRIALSYNNGTTAKWSDYLSNGSSILPLLVYASKIRDKEWLESSIMYADVLMLNTGLVTISKYAIGRHRPFLYDEGKTKTSFGISDSASFYSGHTSFAASNSFFAAAIFQRAYPDSPAVPYVYGIAATIPAVTGYLRVRSGVHFPSDVIIGYAAGAAVAFAVIQVHKKDDIALTASASTLGLTYTF